MYPLIILAGGMATRLGDTVRDIPKCLVPVAGKAFIDWQLDYVSKQGITDIYICSGWLGNKVEDHINAHGYNNLNINIISDGEMLLGTGGAVNNILSILPDHFFILYGDTYLPIDFAKIESYYKNNIDPKKNLLTIYKNNSKLDTSNIIYQNNVIMKYSKIDLDKNMKHIDYGLSIMTKTSFNEYNKVGNFDLANLYEYLVNNKLLYPYLVTKRFYEIGTPEALAESEEYFKRL